jgi:hypothetical protein
LKQDLTLTLEQIAHARCRSQQIDAPVQRDPERVVAWLGAVQAQDLGLARWSIAQRLVDATDKTVDAAVADGSILRTHVLRPTWHFVSRADLPWMVMLTGPRVLARMSPYDRAHGLDAALIQRSTKAIVAAIRKGGHQTRSALADRLRLKGTGADSGWLVGHLLMHAELRGVICSGVPNGAQQTYALVEERAPGAVALTRDEALGELARRYFQSHSPATVLDYRWWSGLSASEAARGIEILGASLHRVRVGSAMYFVDGSAAPFVMRRSRKANLLQAYDELLVGYSETRSVVDIGGVVRQRRPEGLLTRTVLLDGQVVGRWRRDVTRVQLAVTIELCTNIDARGLRAIEQAAARYGAFMQRTATVKIERQS